MHILKQTSRTFYIPITLLGSTLKKTVRSAYLCMRAIDDNEDDETLELEVKVNVLRPPAGLLERTFNDEQYRALIKPYQDVLPEVTCRVGDWITVCPPEIVGKVQAARRQMDNGMADWVKKDFNVQTEAELNDYT